MLHGEGHGRGEEPGSAALKNLPAYGALNVWKVAAGTGEALPGPAMLRCFVGATRPITGDPGKWAWCREGVGSGRSTDRAGRTTEPPVRGRAAASFMRHA